MIPVENEEELSAVAYDRAKSQGELFVSGEDVAGFIATNNQSESIFDEEEITDLYERDYEKQAERISVPPVPKSITDIPPDLLERLIEVSREYQKYTLEGHLAAMKLMDEVGILAMQRWSEIHENRGHNLSERNPGRVNHLLVSKLLKALESTPCPRIAFLGSGFCNDEFFIMSKRPDAHIDCVDSSIMPLYGAESEANDKGLQDQMRFFAENYYGFLVDPPKDMFNGELSDTGYDAIVSHSTLHYSTPIVLRYVTFRLIADALRKPTPDRDPGKLYLAMKTSKSASAHPSRHYSLDPRDVLFNPSVDKKELYYRDFLANKMAADYLLYPTFNMLDYKVAPHPDYDKSGELEYFANIVAEPKEFKEVA